MTTFAMPSAQAQDSTGLRILVVDDSAPMRLLVTHVLKQAGLASVTAVDGGLAALAALDAQPADCVVLDVEMPGMSGFEVLAKLPGGPAGTPVVMLSGFTDQALTDRATAAGAAAYLDKSSQLRQLPETIRRVVQPSDTGPTEAPPPVPEPAQSGVVPKPPELGADSSVDLRELEYAVSHDLGAPLRAIGGFATLLQSRCGPMLDDTGRAFVEHIAAGAADMQAMVDDLLLFTRAANKAPLTERVRMDEVTAAVLDRLGDELLARAAHIELGPVPDVVGDRALIETVLGHVLRNAMIFNTSDAPLVQVSGTCSDSTVTIMISDNGIGVDPARADRAFALFGRLQPRGDYPGTGTGLALCRRLMTLQGGTIELGSSPGRGTVATLTLPAATAEEDAS